MAGIVVGEIIKKKNRRLAENIRENLRNVVSVGYYKK